MCMLTAYWLDSKIVNPARRLTWTLVKTWSFLLFGIPIHVCGRDNTSLTNLELLIEKHKSKSNNSWTKLYWKPTCRQCSFVHSPTCSPQHGQSDLSGHPWRGLTRPQYWRYHLLQYQTGPGPCQVGRISPIRTANISIILKWSFRFKQKNLPWLEQSQFCWALEWIPGCRSLCSWWSRARGHPSRRLASSTIVHFHPTHRDRPAFSVSISVTLD